MAVDPEPSYRQPVRLSHDDLRFVAEEESLIAKRVDEVDRAYHEGRLEEMARGIAPIRERLRPFLD